MSKFEKITYFFTEYCVIPLVTTLVMVVVILNSDIFFNTEPIWAVYSAGVFAAITAVWLSIALILNIAKRVIEHFEYESYLEKSAKITTSFNIVDILTNPDNYINEYSDTEIMIVPNEVASGNILRFLVGVEEGNYYIVVEDDYESEDVYQKENETLMQTFVRALNDNLIRE